MIYSKESYINLITDLKNNTHRIFSDYTAPCSDNTVILRHDIDYDIKMAVDIAEINRELGVAATFFIMTDSQFYNIVSNGMGGLLEKISDSGQKIGLHYCCHRGTFDIDDAERKFMLLKSIIPQAERIIAWHNPDGSLSELNEKAEENGFISAYSENYFSPESYVSDSNLRNSPAEICGFVQENTSRIVQLLIHPFNWIIGGNTMEQILKKLFKSKLIELSENFSGNRVWKQNIANQIASKIDTFNL